MLGPDLMVHEPIVESLLGCSAELKVSGWQVVDVLSERRQHLTGHVLGVDQLPQDIGLDASQQAHRAASVAGGVSRHSDGGVAVAVPQLQQLRFSATTGHYVASNPWDSSSCVKKLAGLEKSSILTT